MSEPMNTQTYAAALACITALEEAVRVLAKYAETRMRKTEFLADRDTAERDRKNAVREIKNNPIAAEAVRKAGG